jgi:sugar-specific transcriptional regulator TrmB
VFTDTQVVRSYFFKLGLSSEIADIYLALLAYGPQTISDVSRHSGVERTRVYRLMDELTTSNLIEIETQYKRTILHAAPITNLQILLTKKEQDLHELREELHGINQQIAENTLASPTTRVQAYHGKENLKQMFWNQTRAKSESVSILHENMQRYTNVAFFDRWARTSNERDLVFRSIVGDSFVESQKTWYQEHANERLAKWSGRYVPEGVFPVTHSTVVYDDVTSYYNWKNGEVFGIEIYNAQIADAQRQFFDMLWTLGQDFDDSPIQELWSKNRKR